MLYLQSNKKIIKSVSPPQNSQLINIMTLKTKKLFLAGGLFLFSGLFLPFSAAFANNLSITNVSLEDRDTGADTVIVEFDIAWNNSWRDTTNHDAVWIIFKATKSSVIYHGNMKTAGTNPSGTSPGSNKDLEIYVPTDKKGAFIRRKSTGSGTVTSENVRLKLDYVASPLSAVDTDTISVKVIGMEMVFIPSATFYAGDTSGAGPFQQGSSDTEPWVISNEGSIFVSNITSNGYYYTKGGALDTYDAATGSTFTIPYNFPKGYAAFYCMKYEITEGQWVDFINTLTAAQQTNRDITSSANSGKNADTVLTRNTIAQSGTGTAAASTSRPDRAMTYLGWMDLCAYLDWAALRPMTELEYEKVARGPLMPVSGEYAWGSASITAAATISGSLEPGTETISTAGANANYNNTSLSGGDTFQGSAYQTGPLRGGIFATGSSTRDASGAGYYGVMELSGNVWERTVTVGNSEGRNFTGSHGDGVLVSVSGYEGNANAAAWPHADTQSSARGVTKSDGSGFRGASWADNGSLTISGRTYGAWRDGSRNNKYGGHGVRTYDGS